MAGLLNCDVRARVWLRVARRPLRLTMTVGRVRVRGVDLAGPRAVLRADVGMTWWALPALHALAFAHRLSLLTVDVVELVP